MFDERAAAQRVQRQLDDTGRLRAPDWHREPRRPALRLPRGACDAHLHVIGPQARFPLLETPFTFLDFADSTIEDWIRVRDALGVTRGVHVQSFMYGYGHDQMLHTLATLPDGLRGVVGVFPEVTDEELDRLTAAGVVGARFTPSLHPEIDERLVGRLVERGWSLHYSVDTDAPVGWRRAILARPGRFVLEHLGLPPPGDGVGSPQFRFTLECLDTGRAWVKLTARASDDPVPPFADLRPLVDAVLERAPQRALWGSDWPHVPYFRPMPDEAELLDVASDWVTDEALVARVFVDNPAELFDWPYPPS